MTIDPAAARIRPYSESDFGAVDALWRKAGNYRPWNDPAKDIALCLKTPTAELLVADVDGRVAGTVMAGHDGHRGWVYYLSVDPDFQRLGLGRRLMTYAEKRLAKAGLPKVQLMVRTDNTPVLAFYRTLGYDDARVATLEKWFDPESTASKKAAYAEAGSSLEITVTSLQMLSRPPRPAATGMPKGVALMRLSEPTTRFYRFLYDTVGEDWLWYERRKMNDADLEAIVTDERVEIHVLYRNGEPAGYGELDRRVSRGIELAYFGLFPHAVGQGLGVRFLHELIDIAWSYEPERFWVHTCTLDHPRALPMYRRAGFTPYNRETRSIEDPRASGLFG